MKKARFIVSFDFLKEILGIPKEWRLNLVHSDVGNETITFFIRGEDIPGEGADVEIYAELTKYPDGGVSIKCIPKK